MVSYSQTVLVIEDSVAMRRIVTNLVKKFGFANVLEAANGVSAMDIMGQNKVDAIITDWNMPEMDGLAFTRLLRANPKFNGVPILMITTEAAKEDILTALRNGVNNYVIKPFSADILKERLFRLLGIVEVPEG
ncbi:chemotaxis response regulator CheY [Deferribacterales bacterium RsTz2092]|nr:chemotaxis protein CheY [Deferribacterales bacterium]